MSLALASRSCRGHSIVRRLCGVKERKRSAKELVVDLNRRSYSDHVNHKPHAALSALLRSLHASLLSLSNMILALSYRRSVASFPSSLSATRALSLTCFNTRNNVVKAAGATARIRSETRSQESPTTAGSFNQLATFSTSSGNNTTGYTSLICDQESTSQSVNLRQGDRCFVAISVWA